MLKNKLMSSITDKVKTIAAKKSSSIEVSNRRPSITNIKSPKIMLKNKLSNENEAQKKKPETPKSQILMKE